MKPFSPEEIKHVFRQMHSQFIELLNLCLAERLMIPPRVAENFVEYLKKIFVARVPVAV